MTCLSSLKSHLTKCQQGPKTIPIKQFSKFVPKNINLPKETFENIKLLLAKFVAGTFSSFRLVESDSFKDIVQYCIEIGSKFGEVDANSILFSRKNCEKNNI